MVGLLIMLVQALPHLDVEYTKATNSNASAVRHFREVAVNSTDSLIIHDDGNNAPESVYNDEGAIAVIEQRLKSGVKIRCVFATREELMMVTKLHTYSGFEVRYLNEEPPFNAHFKIADMGKMAYLSKHPFGSIEREYEMFNCSKSTERVREELFGKLCGQFEEVWRGLPDHSQGPVPEEA